MAGATLRASACDQTVRRGGILSSSCVHWHDCSEACILLLRPEVLHGAADRATKSCHRNTGSFLGSFDTAALAALMPSCRGSLADVLPAWRTGLLPACPARIGGLLPACSARLAGGPSRLRPPGWSRVSQCPARFAVFCKLANSGFCPKVCCGPDLCGSLRGCMSKAAEAVVMMNESRVCFDFTCGVLNLPHALHVALLMSIRAARAPPLFVKLSAHEENFLCGQKGC
mmetsp:Transcript_69454/g.157619  ORF Transcript_69454/g.157619 Transcript_69454/m.157619 type:complete len:228 (+) Transcript_69454:87-770(+)